MQSTVQSAIKRGDKVRLLVSLPGWPRDIPAGTVGRVSQWYDETPFQEEHGFAVFLRFTCPDGHSLVKLHRESFEIVGDGRATVKSDGAGFPTWYVEARGGSIMASFRSEAAARAFAAGLEG